MLENSVLARSGQLWKVLGAICAISVGGAALLYGVISNTADGGGLLWIVTGMLLTFGGLAFACLRVRCPKCGARWVWMAVSQQNSREYGTWLITLPHCPKCAAP